MNRKKNNHALTKHLRFVCSMEMNVQLPKKSINLHKFVVSRNKVKVADSPCPTKSMTPVSYRL